VSEEYPPPIISEKPVLAEFLMKWEPLIIPEGLYKRGVLWIRDVGMLLRSRPYQVHTIAMLVTQFLISTFVPGLKKR